jgi:hypothetical protein
MKRRRKRRRRRRRRRRRSRQATPADIRRHSEEREVAELESQALLEGQR